MSSKQLSRFGSIFTVITTLLLFGASSASAATLSPNTPPKFPDVSQLVKTNQPNAQGNIVVNLKGMQFPDGCENQIVTVVGGTLEIITGTVKDQSLGISYAERRATFKNVIGLDSSGQHYFIEGFATEKLTSNQIYQDKFWQLDINGLRSILRTTELSGQQDVPICTYL